ncbi:MAG TPA: hypothetical protein PLS53_11310 [Thermoanaerobaculaceae bacterium]|nr:hypothetical protein [Thermoanaerobaculaceae bacterium]HPS78734.1 hypothetical protein [Thermoanaerobaculaceae bacterium]
MATFTVTCPHCQALLDIDGDHQVITGSQQPEKPRSTTSLDDRLAALTRERESARSRLDEAMRAERSGAAVREEKFRKLLEGTQGEEPTKPIRDIDLD